MENRGCCRCYKNIGKSGNQLANKEDIMPYKLAVEIIPVALSESIQTFQGKSAEEFRRNFAQARVEYEKHAKGKNKLR